MQQAEDLPWLFDEWCIRVLLSLEDVIFHRNSAFLHESRDERYGIVVIDRRGHSDGHSFRPIQRRHPDRGRAETIVLSLVPRGKVSAAVHEQLDNFVRSLI